MTTPGVSLKDLWRRCFPDGVRNDADARARGEAQWQDQRPQHLPLTREVMKSASQITLRYGSPAQAQGQPTLLLMAGYSPEQLALVIAAHTQSGCSRVISFTGHGVWNTIQDEVASCLDVLSVDVGVLTDPVEIDPANPADVFRKLVGWIREHPDARCAIDCTGGKKPMDSGAVHAASFYGLPAYYLDFDDYDRVMRRPFPWTCIYRELPLPDVVFGLESRRRVFEAFRARRFGDAKRTMTDVLQHAQSSALFEQVEIEELQRADALIVKATAWIDLRYHELPDHPLAPRFERSADLEPRRVVEDLLKAECFDDLFFYLVDEYWRLGLLLEADEMREALVGLVGIAELTVERMFREPWFAGVRIVDARAIEWENHEASTPLPPLDAWNQVFLPVGCLPHSSFGPKIKLLRRGRSTLEVCGWPSGSGAELRHVAPTQGDARLVAKVDVELQTPVTPPLHGLSNSQWEKGFDFPNGDWVDNRHALAHLRAPLLSQKAIDQARQAHEFFVPRLMEALRRIHVGEALELERSGDTDWVRWKSTPPWDRTTRVPWRDNNSDLEQWLRLRL